MPESNVQAASIGQNEAERLVPITRGRRWERMAWGISIFLLGAGLPLFVRMPLWNDVTLYDICAKNVLAGGVHYRDTFDVNFPGIVWLHVGIRSLFGWSSEALRIFDFAVLSATVGLLLHWLRRLERPRVVRAWAATAFYAFYLSTSEYAHCQRDIWMMLPAMAALVLRADQIARLERGGMTSGTVFRYGMMEGACWSIAFWIKPFVLVPAVLCWLVARIGLSKTQKSRAKWQAADTAGLITAALLAALAGGALLWFSGAWPYFWDVMLSWNRGYQAWSAGRSAGMRTLALFVICGPWSIIHLLAVPIALASVYQSVAVRTPPSLNTARSGLIGRGLLSAIYLGWLVQAGYVQLGLYYHHVPVVMLALAVIAAWRFPWGGSRIGQLTLAAFAILSLGTPAMSPKGLSFTPHPAMRWERLSVWPQCVFRSNTPALQDRLALTREADWEESDRVGNRPSPSRPTIRRRVTDWEDLGRVADYLRSQNLRDGEFVCMGPHTISLYRELDLQPPTRFIYFTTLLEMFPWRRNEIWADLLASDHRYVVIDLRDQYSASLIAEEQASGKPGKTGKLPAAFPEVLAGVYSLSEQPVFRSGRYCVYRVDVSMAKMTAQPSASQP